LGIGPKVSDAQSKLATIKPRITWFERPYMYLIKYIFVNIVHHSYRILHIAVSINNIVDMSGNKQFVKTREYMSFIITDALRSSLLPSGESGERVSNSAEAVAAYRTKREKFTPFLRKIFKDDPQFFARFR